MAAVANHTIGGGVGGGLGGGNKRVKVHFCGGCKKSMVCQLFPSTPVLSFIPSSNTYQFTGFPYPKLPSSSILLCIPSFVSPFIWLTFFFLQALPMFTLEGGVKKMEFCSMGCYRKCPAAHSLSSK